MKRKLQMLGVSLALLMTTATVNLAVADKSLIMRDIKSELLKVPLNKSRLIHFDSDNVTVSQSNPEIADVTEFMSREVLIQGKSLGTTNIFVWQKGKRLPTILNVEVMHDLESLKSKLHDLLPGENIEVRSSQKNIVLSGQVSGLDKMQSALDIAQSFLPPSNQSGQVLSPNQAPPTQNVGQGGTSINMTGNNPSNNQKQGLSVINMLSVSGAQQVMLEVKVAEIDRRLARGLDIQFNAMHPSNGVSFGALNGGGTFSPIVTQADAFSTGYQVLSNKGGIAGPIRSLLHQNDHSISASGLFLSAISGDFIFNMTVDAAKDQDLAKILAEPTLTTLSGQEAKFISGGEFPIPVPQSNNGGAGSTITIVFKEFGIAVRFLPVVLDTGRINLNMNVSVSELSKDAAIATDIAGSDLKFTIPSLTKREASSTLELADGQTMSIAGLISDSVRENVNKFPGIGDIPVLGMLFRSEKFLKQQTELVIFVTPKLAKPVLAGNIQLPTDNFVEPDDYDFYVLGSLEKRNPRKKYSSPNTTLPATAKGGMDGQFGHALIEEVK